jgi:hypothetical protein
MHIVYYIKNLSLVFYHSKDFFLSQVEEKLSGIGESLEEFKDLVIKVIVCYDQRGRKDQRGFLFVVLFSCSG